MSSGSIIVLAVVLVVAVLAGWRAINVFSGKKGCCGGEGSCSSHPRTKSVKVADTDKSHYPYGATLAIGGMTCDNCRRNVENALNAVPGTWAHVDLTSRVASIMSKQPVDEKALEAAVDKAGYRVIRA